jgi:hypothetical protein
MRSTEHLASYPFSRVTYLLNLDTDVLLFQSLVAVIVLIALWPLGFLGYLVSVYGSRILWW